MTLQDIKDLNNKETYILQDMILITRHDNQVILSGKVHCYCHESKSYNLTKFDERKVLQILIYNFEIQK